MKHQVALSHLDLKSACCIILGDFKYNNPAIIKFDSVSSRHYTMQISIGRYGAQI